MRLCTIAVCMSFILYFNFCKVVASLLLCSLYCEIVCFMFLGCCGCNVSWCSVRSGCCAFCLSYDACSACCLMGSMVISSCRCCTLVSRVSSVLIRSAIFCMICNLFLFVSDIIGDQIALPYFDVELVMAVYGLSSVS